ncbi:MAG TPA: hypothetical protein VK636_05440 [Gemmatimonadaceae bacterium]|nr:hypothetical protein [Gemmatimonadaceae bacterium]
MAITGAALKQRFIRYRLPSEVIAVSLLAVIVFLTVGMGARRRIEPVRTEITKLHVALGEVSQFRAGFQPSAPNKDVRMANIPDSLSVALPRDRRVSLAERIAARAEQDGLSDVRVKFAAPDSAAVPNRPDLMGATVAIADYSVSVECTGGFAALLSLVNHLPPSVAVQRLTAEQTKNGPQYRLILAVFEAVGSSQHG